MNSINLPSAAIPQLTGAASAQSGLPLDLAMLDSAVPEELFAALLAGQLQGLVAVTGEIPEGAVQDLAEETLSQAGESGLSALLLAPQDGAVLAATAVIAGGQLPVAALAEVTDNELGNAMDPSLIARQALAASAAAFAAPVPSAAVPGNSLRQGASAEPALPLMPVQLASANASSALAVPTTTVQSDSVVAFAFPQMQLAAPLNSAPASVVPQATIPQPVGSQAWGGMVGERVVWMFGQQHQSAEIMLNPPSLGPLEVRLSMSDGQANLTFTTQHAPVREALEAATPRLREMLTESGIGLGTVSVNVGNFTRQDPQSQQQTAERQPSGWTEDSAMNDFTVLATDLPSRRGNGLLDLFA